MQQSALYHCHDSPAAGHQDVECEGYWVNMAQDVEKYCRECQHSKLTLTSKAPLVSTPIGNPWQIIAVDILIVPVSTQGNKYLLVFFIVQDYFTKWADAIPLPNQRAPTITLALIKLFSTMGMSQIVHSDQGRVQ